MTYSKYYHFICEFDERLTKGEQRKLLRFLKMFDSDAPNESDIDETGVPSYKWRKPHYAHEALRDLLSRIRKPGRFVLIPSQRDHACTSYEDWQFIFEKVCPICKLAESNTAIVSLVPCKPVIIQADWHHF